METRVDRLLDQALRQKTPDWHLCHHETQFLPGVR
jgi:hypothetical protein